MNSRLTAGARLLGVLILALFVAIQFIPVEWPERKGGEEIPAPPEIREILRTHCYDCHSSRQKRPWYSQIAPVSWLVSYDINHGVSRLDFSNWQSETPNSAMYKIAHTGHRVREGKGKTGDWMMPPASYVRFGSGRALTSDELSKLLEWAGRHGMNLDGSDQRLRLRSQPPEDRDWPYVAAVGSLVLDAASELEGKVLEPAVVASPDLGEFDPLTSSRAPANRSVLTGLNRQMGDYRGESELNQALLFVEDGVEARISGRGAVLAGGDVSLEIASQKTELFVLTAGKITVKGGGSDCRLALVSPSVVTLTNLEGRGSIVAGQLRLQHSIFKYDSQMTQNEMTFPPSRRTVLTYCDQDGELTESDRRMEVLYEAGTFTLHDPEYNLTKHASSPSEAYQRAQEILIADPTMELGSFEGKGFNRVWLERFAKLSSDQGSTTLFDYHVGEWIQP